MMDDEQSRTDHRSLSEALGLGKKEMICLTGAGGKTTLMFRLAHELYLKGKNVITTTTTKIKEPSKDEAPHLFVSTNEKEMKRFVSLHLPTGRHLTLAVERLEEGKLRGISPDLADLLWSLHEINYMIIEADGAAGRPIKAPREQEPVIPKNTTLVIALLGLDGIGKELNDQNVFQAHLVSKLTGILEGEKIAGEGMARLFTHPQGLFKGTPPSARRIAFLNKMDVLEEMTQADALARFIFEKGGFEIERVVLGQVKERWPVVQVLVKEGFERKEKRRE